MSAYMCSSKVLSAITDGIIFMIQKYGYTDLLIEFSTDRDEVFNKLFVMNRCALIERYGEETASDMCNLDDMKYNTTLSFGVLDYGDDYPLYALYSCILTYLYQCHEGHIDKSNTYVTLNDLANAVACSIVNRSTAYKLMTDEVARW